jgi:hypothetical protein
VIWESKPWKDDLLANARLLKRLQPKRRSARWEYEIERVVFISVYAMRKLWEAGKHSSAWQNRLSPCSLHKPKGKHVDRLNWHRLGELYHLENSENVSLTAIELCNRLIHSFVFVVVSGPRRTIDGFFFTSDQTRHRGLWFIEFSEILALLTETGRDYPSSGHMVRDPRTNDWVQWSGHGDPPNEWTKAVENLHRLRTADKSKNAKSID